MTEENWDFCLFHYVDDEGREVATVTSPEAWWAVKRLMGLPTLPERKLSFEVGYRDAFTNQWEEIERIVNQEMTKAIEAEHFTGPRC